MRDDIENLFSGLVCSGVRPDRTTSLSSTTLTALPSFQGHSPAAHPSLGTRKGFVIVQQALVRLTQRALGSYWKWPGEGCEFWKCRRAMKVDLEVMIMYNMWELLGVLKSWETFFVFNSG